jgi:hypothetical protein
MNSPVPPMFQFKKLATVASPGPGPPCSNIECQQLRPPRVMNSPVPPHVPKWKVSNCVLPRVLNSPVPAPSTLYCSMLSLITRMKSFFCKEIVCFFSLSCRLVSGECADASLGVILQFLLCSALPHSWIRNHEQLTLLCQASQLQVTIFKYIYRFNQSCGSGFNRVSGSGSGSKRAK